MDLSRVYDAFLKADAAGDVESATALAKYIRQTAPAPEITEADIKPDYSPWEMAKKAIVRGGKQISSTFGDLIPAMGAKALGFDEYAKKQMGEAAETQKEIQQHYAPQYQGTQDVHGFGNAVGFGVETIAEQIPNLITALIPGIGAGATAARVSAGTVAKGLAAQALEKGLAGEAAATFVAQGLKQAAPQIMAKQQLGTNVGTYLGSYAMNAPEIFQNIYEKTGEMAPGASALYGVLSAALDSVLPASLANKITGPTKIGVVEALLKKSGMERGLARGVAAEAIKDTVGEGITEGMQEAISIHAENFVANHPQIFGSKEWDRIVQSSIKGAIAGGGFGTVGGAYGAAREGSERRQQYQEALAKRQGQLQERGVRDMEAQNVQMTLPGIEPRPEGELYQGPEGAPTPPEGPVEGPPAPPMKGQGDFFTQEGKLSPAAEKQATKEDKATEKEQKDQAKKEADDLKAAQDKLKTALTELTQGPFEGGKVNLAGLAADTTPPLQRTITAQQAELDKLAGKRAPLPETATTTTTAEPAVQQAKVPTHLDPVQTTITHDVLAALGINNKGILRREGERAVPGKVVLGKDISDPVQAQEVKAILTEHADKVSEGNRKKVEAFLARPEFQQIAPAEEVTNGQPTTTPTTTSPVVDQPITGADQSGLQPDSQPAANIEGTGGTGEPVGEGLGKTPVPAGSANVGEIKSEPPLAETPAAKKPLPTYEEMHQGVDPKIPVMSYNGIIQAKKDEARANGYTTKEINAHFNPAMDAFKKQRTELIAQEKANAKAEADHIRAEKKAAQTPVVAEEQITPDNIGGVPVTRKNQKRSMRERAVDEGTQAAQDITDAANTQVEDSLRAQLEATAKSRGIPPKKVGAIKGLKDTLIHKFRVVAGLLNSYVQAHGEATYSGGPLTDEIATNARKVGIAKQMVGVVPNEKIPQILNAIKKNPTLANVLIKALNHEADVEYRKLTDKHLTLSKADFNQLNEEQKAAILLADKAAEAAEKPKVRKATKELSIDEAIDQILKNTGFSEGEAPATATTAKDINDTINRAFQNPENADRLVTTHNTVEEAMAADPAAMQQARDPSRVKAFIGSDGRVHLIAANIPAGRELGVLLHEIGTHLGMRNILSEGDMNWLATMVHRYANKNDGSVESRVAQAAISKAEQSSSVDKREELIAYMTEGLVNEDVTPESMSGPAKNWFQKVYAAIGKLLNKIKMRGADLTGQEIVDFMHGAAAMRFADAREVTPGGVKFSDAETADNLFHGKGTSVSQGFNAIGTMMKGVPSLSGKAVESTKNYLSNVKGSKAVKLAMGLLRLDHINELYGKTLTSIQPLIDNLEKRTGKQERMIQVVIDNANKFDKIFAANKAASERMNDMAYDANLANVDPMVANFKTDASNQAEYARLRNIYTNLPKDVQWMYKEIRDSYSGALEDYKKLLFGDDKAPGMVSPSIAAKLKGQFEANKAKIVGYIPFLRKGEFLVEYADPATGDRAVSAFESLRERDLFVKQVLAPQNISAKLYQHIESIKYGTQGIPPTNFIAQVMNDIRTQGEKQKLTQGQISGQLDSVYQAYLTLMPAQSISKHFMKRDNVRGMERDIIRGYKETMVGWTRKLANTEYLPKIDKSLSEIRVQGETADPHTAAAANNIMEQEPFFHDPNYGWFVHGATQLSYFEFIAGNTSSAIVNTTALPLLVYPTLGAKFGFPQAASAMANASKAFFGFEKGEKYHGLYEAMMDHAQLKHTVAAELMEGRRTKTSDYTGTMAKIKSALAFPFSATERFNRGVTAIAAYDLAKNGDVNSKKMSDVEAIRYAIDTVKSMHTSGLAATAPKYMQHPLGRMFFTFKQFTWNSAYIVARAFHQSFKGESKEVRRIAQRQVVATFGMAGAFAGVKGLPFYGMASVLARMINSLFGDDDDDYDPNEQLRQAIGELPYKGFANYLTGWELSNRVGLAQDLFFRDDPRGVAQDGYVLTAMKNAFGPGGSYVAGVENAAKMLGDGHIERAFETLMPSFVRNGMKGMRYGLEGARTLKGDLVDEDVSAYNAVSQMFGFAPADLSSRYETTSAAKNAERSIMAKRQKILDIYEMGYTSGDSDLMAEAVERAANFTAAHPGEPINFQTFQKSITARRNAEKNMINGVAFNRKLRGELEEDFMLSK